MYESFFGLRVKPFDLLSDPDFLFQGRFHKKALTYLDYALHERAGFMLLTGEVGSGKTILIRELLRRHKDSTVVAKVFYTNLTPDQLLAMVVDDFGVKAVSGDKTDLLRALYDFLIEQYARGLKPLLIIDEAQNLSHEALEEVRMLSNLETDRGKLLQILMAGQPELRTKLAAPSLLPLRQRISVSCRLHPLAQDEVGAYVAHRLKVAGNPDAAIFTADALELVYRYSRGVPRLINIICDYLLLSAFAEDARHITAALVQDVAGELDFERHFWGAEEGHEYGPDAGSLPKPPGFLVRETLDGVTERASGYDTDSARKGGSKRGLLGKLFREI